MKSTITKLFLCCVLALFIGACGDDHDHHGDHGHHDDHGHEKPKKDGSKAKGSETKPEEMKKKYPELANYPLSKCVVSGEPLGSIGAPVKETIEGTDIFFLCKHCVKKAKADPKATLEKYNAAVKAASTK